MVRGAPCSVVEVDLRVSSVSAITSSLGGMRGSSIAHHLPSCGRLLGWFSLAAGCAYRRSAGAAEFALPACGVWGAGGCCVVVAVLMLTCPTTAAANQFKGWRETPVQDPCALRRHGPGAVSARGRPAIGEPQPVHEEGLLQGAPPCGTA